MSISDTERIPGSALVLGLIGTTPAWVLTALLWSPSSPIGQHQAITALIAYAAIALAFAGGIRWGTAVGPYGAGRLWSDFALAGLPALAGLIAVFLPPAPALSLLVAGYLTSAFWDVASTEQGRLPLWYGKLRALLTALIVLPLLGALVRAVL
jgi:hypothetical protein